MSGAAVLTEPTLATTRIHMMSNHKELRSEWGDFPSIDAFLDKVCPDDKPPKTARFAECFVDLGGIKIRALSLGNHIFIGMGNARVGNDRDRDWQTWSQTYQYGAETVDPFVKTEFSEFKI